MDPDIAEIMKVAVKAGLTLHHDKDVQAGSNDEMAQGHSDASLDPEAHEAVVQAEGASDESKFELPKIKLKGFWEATELVC